MGIEGTCIITHGGHAGRESDEEEGWWGQGGATSKANWHQ